MMQSYMAAEFSLELRVQPLYEATLDPISLVSTFS
jgi:hypothetical protein